MTEIRTETFVTSPSGQIIPLVPVSPNLSISTSAVAANPMANQLTITVPALGTSAANVSVADLAQVPSAAIDSAVAAKQAIQSQLSVAAEQVAKSPIAMQGAAGAIAAGAGVVAGYLYAHKKKSKASHRKKAIRRKSKRR